MIGKIVATDPNYGLNMSQVIGDIRKSTFPDLRQSKKLDTSINRQFTNNLVALLIFAEVLDDKISDSSSRDIYTHCKINRVVDPINIPALQLVDLGISSINALDKSASLWTPTTRVGMNKDVAHGRAPYHI